MININSEKVGNKMGYVFGYFLFTTILFLILNLVKKSGWNYLNTIGITILIVIIGVSIKKLLK